MRSEMVQCDMTRTSTTKCSTEMQTSFCEEVRRSSPSKRQASLEDHELDESPSKKSNREEPCAMPKICRFDCPDECIDDLVEANSDSSRGIDVTISARLRCRKHLGRGRFVEQHQGGCVLQEGATLSAKDAGQSVAFTFAGDLYERSEESRRSLEDLATFAERYETKVEENRRQAFVVDELKQRNKDLERQVTSTHMSLNEKVELEKQVISLLKEKAGLEQEVDRLRIQNQGLSEKEKEVLALKFNFNNQMASIKMLEHQKVDLEKRVSSSQTLQHQNANLQRTMDELRSENADLVNRVTRLTQVVEEKTGHIARVNIEKELESEKNVKEKNAKIEKLELQRAAFEKQLSGIGTLQQEKSELERRLEELRIDNEALREKVNYLTSLLEEKSGSEAQIVAKAEKDVKEKLVVIERLELQKADLEKRVIQTETLLEEKRCLEGNGKELRQRNEGLEKEVARLRSLVEKSEQTPTVTQLQSDRDNLQTEVARLQKEVEETKNSIHEQRIRVLDLKHELREKTAASENEIALLTFKLNKAETSASDATESATKCRERETQMKSKLEETQTELIQVRDELRQTVAELKSQKGDFEIQVQKLTSEIEVLRVSTEEARTRKDQFQSEFREAAEKFQSSETKLKEQESRLHLVTSQSNQLKLVNEQLKTDLDEKRSKSQMLEQQNEELKGLCKELESQIEDLEMLEEHKDAELKELSERLKSSEKLMESAKRAEQSKLLRELEETKTRLSQYKMQAETLSAQVIQLEHGRSVLEVENRSMKCRLEGSTQGAKKLQDDITNQMQSSLEEKNRLRQEGERLKQELADSKSGNEQLRYVCSELENQVKMLEEICEQHEKQLSQDQSKQSVFKKALSEQEREAEQFSRQLQNERDGRKRAEDKVAELKKALASVQTSGSSECERLRAQMTQQSMQLNSLNEQLTASEHKFSMMELDNKNLQRYVELRDQEMITIKEEISKEITRLQSLKTTNLQLNKDVETANELNDSLKAEKTALLNHIESMEANYQQERFRREETICQQAKLIDFLQGKVENTPRKKKLFSSKRDAPGIQLICGENEREICNVQRGEIVQLRGELNQTKTELDRYRCALGDGAPASASVPSSASKDQRSHTLPPVRSVNAGASTPISATQQKRLSERNPINNPHKFVMGINMRPSKCIVCLGPIHFVQEVARCQDCRAVCHPKCLPDVPASCGSPNEYSLYMTDVMLRAKAASTDSMQPSVANLHLQMTGDMKISKRGRQSLERKWVVLRDNKLYIYNSREDQANNPIEEFDLCPPDGEVSVQSAVTSVELHKVIPADLPYIMMLEFEPDSCSIPARRLYMMALSFKQKQHWVAAIEAIINTNLKSSQIRDLRVLGNTILRLPKDRWLEINCTWPLNDEVILVGAVSGLFAMVLANMPDNRLLIKIEGVTTVYSILGQKSMDFLVIICGRDRDLVTVDLATVQRCIAHIRAGTRREPVSVVPQAVTMASMCTAFEVSQAVDGLYLCAATMDKVVLYKYNNSLREFLVRKEVQTNCPCNCLHFGQRRVLFGTDRFYQMDLEKYSVSEFLDKKDPSLAFAALGATQYDCSPIAVFAVSSWNEPEEFLLCFHEFGVFIDGSGRRKREKNVKWTGLPLAFAYRTPFLYTIHFNAVQIIEIMPGHDTNSIGLKTFVNVHGAQYLGPAVMSGAIYVGSTSCEGNTELICIMGNQGATPARNCEKENARSSRHLTSEMGFVSPLPITPSARRMSPKRSTYTERNSITSNSSDDLTFPTRISSGSRVQRVRQQHTPVVPSAPRLDTSTASSTNSTQM